MYPELYSLKNLEKRQVEHNKQTSTNLLKDINPDDIKISIDESTGMMQISGQQQYKCGRYLNFSESRKLPDYIIKNKLYHKVRCTFVDGRIRIDLPDNNSTCTVSRSPYKLKLSPSLTGSKTSGSHPGSDSGIMSASSSLKK